MSKKDLTKYSPAAASSDFFKEHGFRFEDWYDDADSIIDRIEAMGFGELQTRDVDSEIDHRPVPPFNFYFTDKNLSKYGMRGEDIYVAPGRPNRHGLRSDDFKKEHDGLHILFAGCSITFGDGMFEEYSWPMITYNKIKEANKVSGYYNVAMNGANHLDIYTQILAYIKEVGDPDVIFINFPDFGRLIDSGFSESHLFAIRVMHQMLESYCEKSKINLISFSWDSSANEDSEDAPDSGNYAQYDNDPRSDMGETYHKFSCEDRNKFIFDMCKAQKNHKFIDHFERAFDVVHPGIAEHAFYADFAYRLFLKDNIGAN